MKTFTAGLSAVGLVTGFLFDVPIIVLLGIFAGYMYLDMIVND